MRPLRRQVTFLFAILTSLAMATALAWACTAVPSVSSGLRIGAPGTAVPFEGTGFADAEKVEIRWNSPDGPIVGEALGPNFSTMLEIPQADPGIYYIVAVQKAADGTVSGKATDTFEVTAPIADLSAGPAGSAGATSSAGSSVDLWEGFRSSGSSLDQISASTDPAYGRSSIAFTVGLGLVLAGAGALTVGMIAGKRIRARRSGRTTL